MGAGEHTGADLNRHFIVLWDVHPYPGERSELYGRRFAPYVKNPGVLSLVPSGVQPAHLSDGSRGVCPRSCLR